MITTRQAHRPAIAITIAVAVCLWLDPYSHGLVGGEYRIFRSDFREVAVYSWQRHATFLLVLLLLIGTVQLLRGSTLLAILAYAGEAFAYFALNVIYITRDGLLTRTLEGDQGSMQPGLAAGAGLLLRVALIMLVLRSWRADARNVP